MKPVIGGKKNTEVDENQESELSSAIKNIKQGERIRVQRSEPREVTTEDVERLIESTKAFGLTPEAIESAIISKYEPKIDQLDALRESLDKIKPMMDLRYAQPLVTALGGRDLKVLGPDDTRLQEARALARQIGDMEIEKIAGMKDIFKAATNILPRGQVMMATDIQRQLPRTTGAGDNNVLKLEKEMTQEVGKIQQKFEDANRSLAAIKGALATGNTQTVVSQLPNLARLAGEKGVLTDNDIRRQMANSLGKVISDIDAFFRGDFSSDQYSLEQVQTIVRILENALQSQFKKDRDNFEGRYKIRTGFIAAKGPEYVKSLDETYSRSYQQPKQKKSLLEALGVKPSAAAKPAEKVSPNKDKEVSPNKDKEAAPKKKKLWEVLAK